MKIGFFGGSFNPPHMGHIQSLQTIQKKLGLKKIHIIPAFQNPLKRNLEGPTPEQRLEMTKLAFQTFGDQFVVDDREIKRAGKSYTIDTIKELQKLYPDDQLHMIIGADLFEELPKWKELDQILTRTNIIVTTRPGFELPEAIDDLPTWLKSHVSQFDFNFIDLKTGKSIQFISLNDLEISSSELRKTLRQGRTADHFIPLSTEKYIVENNIYKIQTQKIASYKKFTEFCADILFSKKAISLRGLDISAKSSTTEFVIIASGTSTRHASALAENVIRSVKEEFNVRPFSVEGADEGRWVVIDYGSLMIHLFYDFIRQEYNLEGLWKDGKDLGLKDRDLPL